MPTHSHLVQVLLDALLRALRNPQLYIPAIGVALALVVPRLRNYRLHRKQALLEQKARNWPTITAAIEVPTVTGDRISGKGPILGTLTYFYRNPELQMGEYKRPFETTARAKAWVKQFKNRTVLVHVNPADPADSVLFESEIAGADVPESAIREVAGVSGDANSKSLAAGDAIHALTPAMRLLCGIAEIAGLAGFATSLVLLAASFLRGPLPPRAYYWICGILLAVVLGCTAALYVELARSQSGRQLLRTYRRWCPAWMRWSLSVTGVFFGFLHPLLGIFGPILRPYMHSLTKRLEPHLPYLLGCWVFFVLTAFLAAILASQEDPHAVIETAQA